MKRVELIYDGQEILVITDAEFDRIDCRYARGLPYEVQKLIEKAFALDDKEE